MKSFNENLAKKIPAIITLITLAVVAYFLLSCSAPQQLTEPNYNDRIVVGYSKNMKYYKVVDQNGISRTDIRIDSIIRPVGAIFIANHRGVYNRY
jgi:hypothetical protein